MPEIASPKLRGLHTTAVIVAIVAPILGIALILVETFGASDSSNILVLYPAGFGLIVLGINGVVWILVVRSINGNPRAKARGGLIGTLVLLIVMSPIITFVLVLLGVIIVLSVPPTADFWGSP
jgi:hypothetical protein